MVTHVTQVSSHVPQQALDLSAGVLVIELAEAHNLYPLQRLEIAGTVDVAKTVDALGAKDAPDD